MGRAVSKVKAMTLTYQLHVSIKDGAYFWTHLIPLMAAVFNTTLSPISICKKKRSS